MAERKSIKNYDVLDDITGQEEDIVLTGYKLSNSTTKGIRVSALGGSANLKITKIYDTNGAGGPATLTLPGFETMPEFILVEVKSSAGSGTDGGRTCIWINLKGRGPGDDLYTTYYVHFDEFDDFIFSTLLLRSGQWEYASELSNDEIELTVQVSGGMYEGGILKVYKAEVTA